MFSVSRDVQYLLICHSLQKIASTKLHITHFRLYLAWLCYSLCGSHAVIHTLGKNEVAKFTLSHVTFFSKMNGVSRGWCRLDEFLAFPIKFCCSHFDTIWCREVEVVQNYQVLTRERREIGLWIDICLIPHLVQVIIILLDTLWHLDELNLNVCDD